MKPINTALLSFGMSGWVFHAPFIHVHPRFNLYAVWERTKNEAEAKYPGIRTYRTLEELLADEAIELVVVNTPNATHFDFAKAALNAGKHVIVEKPFTVRFEEATELIDLAQEKGLLLSVYHNRRFDSDYKVVKRVVQEGWLGDIVEAEFHFDRFKNELSPKAHKEAPVAGTGALYDLGSHLIDQALQLFGVPQEIFADIRMVRTGSQVDDYFELLFYYPGYRVRLKCSYLVREPLPAYIIHGTMGSFIKEKSDIQEGALQAGKEPGSADWGAEPQDEQGLLHTEKDGKVIKERLASENGNYAHYYDGIFESLRNGATVPVPPSDAALVVKVIETAFRSHEEKKVTPFNA